MALVPSGGDNEGGNGDMIDNSVNHTWCFNVKPGTHTFSIKMGTSCGESLTPDCDDEVPYLPTSPWKTLTFSSTPPLRRPANAQQPVDLCLRLVL